jgi:hypothetical protein
VHVTFADLLHPDGETDPIWNSTIDKVLSIFGQQISRSQLCAIFGAYLPFLAQKKSAERHRVPRWIADNLIR